LATLTGNSRRREQRLQEQMINRQSQKFERRLSREISSAMRKAADNLESGNAAPVDAIEEDHRDRITTILETLWRESGQTMAEHILGVERSWSGKIERKNFDVRPEDIVDGLLADWIQSEGGSKIRRISRTTLSDVRGIIDRGTRDGQTIDDIAKSIRSVAPQKSSNRAKTIARTETHSANNFAAQKSAEATGLNMVRVWVSAQGERTRSIADGAEFDHIAADGQQRGMSEPFVIEGISGSEKLMYPGDPAGSAANIIHCRCAVVFEME